MIIVMRTWRVPEGCDASEFDRYSRETEVPLVRQLPGLRRHVVLRGVASPTAGRPVGDTPTTRRGDDLWFRDLDDLEVALTSSQWKAVEEAGVSPSLTYSRWTLAEVIEEHVTNE